MKAIIFAGMLLATAIPSVALADTTVILVPDNATVTIEPASTPGIAGGGWVDPADILTGTLGGNCPLIVSLNQRSLKCETYCRDKDEKCNAPPMFKWETINTWKSKLGIH